MNQGTADAQYAERKQQAAARACALSFVGRQPIYDRQLRVMGYELLFRAHEQAAEAGQLQPEQATAPVLLNVFVDIGLETVVGPGKAFINFSRDLLLSDYPRVLPPGQVVIEVLESVSVDDELQTAIRSLRQAGYQIALDDFTGQAHLRPLIRLAHIVKVDLPGCNGGDLAQRVATLRQANLKLLAEKVETQGEFRRCMELGFDYFQGYVLRRPEVVQGRRAPTMRSSVVQLMERLCDPDVELHQLERLIQNDVSLSYKLLRLANSSLLPAHNTVASVRQALQLVGLKTITAWTGLFLLSGLSDKPYDVLEAALLRANMCQLLAAPVAPDLASTFFLVGLFSVLDVLLDRPMEELVRSLSLTPQVQQALVAREGPFGETLQIVIDYEQGRWTEFDREDFDRPTIVKAYLDALALTDEMTRVLGHRA
jgi:EAL and modified HD-GYP domain-containing signal transduction protein